MPVDGTSATEWKGLRLVKKDITVHLFNQPMAGCKECNSTPFLLPVITVRKRKLPTAYMAPTENFGVNRS
jgi:hypothetical protein